MFSIEVFKFKGTAACSAHGQKLERETFQGCFYDFFWNLYVIIWSSFSSVSNYYNLNEILDNSFLKYKYQNFVSTKT